MPKILAATVAEHRELRREALLTAGAQLMARGGAFTMAEVAAEVGLSRSAVYEYYTSAADLIADILVDELATWAEALQDAVEGIDDPRARVHAWVTAVLDYVADGRHQLVRAAGSIDLPPTRKAQVQSMHADLVTPLTRAIADLGAAAPVQVSRYVWGAVDAAISRIEAGEAPADSEARAVLAFIQSGLQQISTPPPA